MIMGMAVVVNFNTVVVVIVGFISCLHFLIMMMMIMIKIIIVVMMIMKMKMILMIVLITLFIYYYQVYRDDDVVNVDNFVVIVR